jgi:hypothetical protein
MKLGTLHTHLSACIGRQVGIHMLTAADGLIFGAVHKLCICSSHGIKKRSELTIHFIVSNILG